MAKNEFRLIIEQASEGKSTDAFQPKTKAEAADVDYSQQIISNLPFGSVISQGISTAENLVSISQNMQNGGGAMGIAMTALSIAKKAHELASAYVKDLRQSKEIQRRAFYRRNER